MLDFIADYECPISLVAVIACRQEIVYLQSKLWWWAQEIESFGGLVLFNRSLVVVALAAVAPAE
jgi:hypothetical protein